VRGILLLLIVAQEISLSYIFEKAGASRDHIMSSSSTSSAPVVKVDVGSFAEEEFDVKGWVNSALSRYWGPRFDSMIMQPNVQRRAIPSLRRSYY